ncbi:MAG: hypothetical protein FJZ04_00110 [Candidatus Moranbacteria bacterium]|nr:hypothetical protein [Candidatus Moranbacteria bacterium]
MNKRKIYVFGNPLLPEDNLPLKLAPRLGKAFPKIKFIAADPNENLKPENEALYIIDTIRARSPNPEVQNLTSKFQNVKFLTRKKKVLVIKDLDQVSLNKIYSAHDLDLGFSLKLLAKIGQLRKVIIFGVPVGMGEEEALKQLSEKILNFKF